MSETTLLLWFLINIFINYLNYINFKVVAQGSRVPHHEVDGVDPFAAPKRRGIFQIIDSKSDMRTEVIIKRIFDRR